jgi:hypothetical protein
MKTFVAPGLSLAFELALQRITDVFGRPAGHALRPDPISVFPRRAED